MNSPAKFQLADMLKAALDNAGEKRDVKYALANLSAQERTTLAELLNEYLVIDDVRAQRALPIQHGTRSRSKTRCPGCGALLNDNGTCSAEPERSLPPAAPTPTGVAS